jgi:hypothetical protein
MQAAASHLYVCSGEPTSYAEAVSAYCLGYKSWGAGACLTGPVAGINPVGMKVSTVDVTDGTIVTSGTAAWWAIVTAPAFAFRSRPTVGKTMVGGLLVVPAFPQQNQAFEPILSDKWAFSRQCIEAPALGFWKASKTGGSQEGSAPGASIVRGQIFLMVLRVERTAPAGASSRPGSPGPVQATVGGSANRDRSTCILRLATVSNARRPACLADTRKARTRVPARGARKHS